MLVALGAAVGALGWNVYRLGLDAGFTSREITVHFDGIHGASLVRVNPVVIFSKKKTQLVNSLLQNGKLNNNFLLILIPTKTF